MQQWQEEVGVGIRTLAGSSMQRSVSVAVLVGRVSPEPKKQAQGWGIVAGTGPMQWRGLPSIYIEAGVSLEEGLGLGQPACRQVPAEATLSAQAAGGGSHGTGMPGPQSRRPDPGVQSLSEQGRKEGGDTLGQRKRRH